MSEPNGIEARLEAEWRELLGSVSVKKSPLDVPPESRMASSRVALFAQLEEVREDWHALRDAIDETMGERFANASWTLKDLLAHLASWAKEFRFEVETVLEKRSFDYAIPYAMSALGPSQWNEREVRLRKERSLSEIFDEFELETVRLQELVAGIADRQLFDRAEFPLAPSGNPAERWIGPLAFIIAAKCMHDRHHLGQIRERIKRFGK